MRLTGFRRYFANTSWLMAERVLRTAIAFLVGIYVARYLGPQKYGVFNYATSFVGLFSVFAALGMNQILVRDLLHTADEQDRLLGTAFVLRLEGALFGFVLIVVIAWLTAVEQRALILIVIIAGGLFFQSFNVVDLYFQSRVQSKYVVYAKFAQNFFSAGMRLYGVYIGANLVYFAWIVLAEAGLLALGLVIFYIRKERSLLGWRFRKVTASRMLRQSWPLIISGLAIAVYMKIDQVMLMQMLGGRAVGRYAAAVRLSEAWYFVPVLITTSLFPAIVNYRKHDEPLYHHRLRQLYGLLIWMAVVPALIVSVLANPIIHVLYGSAFAGAGGVLAIHVWGGLFVFIGAASGKWLILEGLQIISSVNTVLGAVVNVALNLVLIPRFGIEGAAIATVASYAFAAYLGLLFWRSSRTNFVEITKAINPFNLLS